MPRAIRPLLAMTLCLAMSTRVPGQVTTLESVDPVGGQGDGVSLAGGISADGSVVTFYSYADNLVANDNNLTGDIFVRDRSTGVVTRVSVSSAGVEGNGESLEPVISDDGNVVAFWSFSDNLALNDTNGEADIFVHDRRTGVTTRVSVDSAGNECNGNCQAPKINGAGTIVAFWSDATNLVPGDTNNVADVFVHDITTGTTVRVSVDSSGAEGDGPSNWCDLSDDGLVIAFESQAKNLVTSDLNNKIDVFVRDLSTGATERVSVDSSGLDANNHSSLPTISGDGGLVAFYSRATNLVANDSNFASDCFVRDRVAGTTIRVSVDSQGNEGNNASSAAGISKDGRFVCFRSDATNLVSPQESTSYTDIFRRDLATATTIKLSVNASGSESNGRSLFPYSISRDGRFSAFSSEATDLVGRRATGDGRT